MKKASVTFRSLVLALLTIPYLLVVLGVLSNYVALYHRVSFQALVASSPQEDLKTFVFSSSEFKKIKWIEEEKEFEHRGKMYDVAKIGKQGNHYVIVCESDSFEDLFIGVLKAASKAKSKMVPQIQFSHAIAGLEIKEPVVAFEKVRGIHSDFYLSFLKEIIPPPPRVF